jgi:NitT/TauT family transport system ATP-binding protein
MDIRIVEVSKSFGQNQVLNNVNLTFQEGKTNIIMGASGVGKTTLLNIIMGIIKPDEGSILGVDGLRMAAVFEEDRLIEHLDAVKNVKLIGDSSLTSEMIEKEFELVCLNDYRSKPVKSLSQGMRRRVAIVRAVLSPCDLILMDEPFHGLDEELKLKVINYVKLRAAGKTLIIITHERTEVAALGTEPIFLG